MVRRTADGSDLAAIGDAAREYGVDRLVLGLPINMDGSEGPAARAAREFARRLGTDLGLPVDLFDERLSTFEAEDRLRARGLSAREMKAYVDAEAAAVILQAWLDGRSACAS